MSLGTAKPHIDKLNMMETKVQKVNMCQAEPAEEAQAQAMEYSGFTLLLVEDNDINQMVAIEILDEYGFDIDVVENGKAAVEAVIAKDYKIVLMDIQMPVMDGIEACKQIRAMGGKYQALPILAMTAHAITGDMDKSLQAGMNGHITKPFEVEDLMGAIRQLLSVG